MTGSQPQGKGIDPEMIRDRGGDVELLEAEIRDIELAALEAQHRLALARPMPRARAHHWWRRSE
jgi:hypothetical protein